MSNWPTNEVCDLLGIEHPIVQAPMASAATPALAAAVSNAGGLGSLGSATLSPEQFGEQVGAFRAESNRPFNANFFVHAEPARDAEAEAAMRERLAPYYAELALGEAPAARSIFPIFGEEMLAAVTALRPPVVSFHFGLPERGVIDALKQTGAVILGSATTVREAVALQAGGADAVIAQGYEAGGHRGTFLGDVESGSVGTFALVPQVVDAVGLPVIAAGAVADGRGIAAAFALGAGGAQIGTAFLACPETEVHPVHRELLLQARGESTQVTRTISGRPARAIANRYVAEMSESGAEPLAFPLQYSLMGPLNAASRQRDSSDLMVMWAGQGAALSRPLPAGELLTKLANEAQAVIAAM
ncbi:MAG: nitronate monooxygenase [Alphaproteobacteria bacterium]|nr:nitronate monooxygenase [Alphaproteobacteria bacterium]